MKNIYDDVIEAQGILSLIDSRNELLPMVRVEKNGVYYSPKFLKDYCSGGVVTDDILREYISDLETALEDTAAIDKFLREI